MDEKDKATLRRMHPPGQSNAAFMTNKSGTLDFTLQSAGGMVAPGDYDPTESFKKFMPRSEKKKLHKGMLDELQDFQYTPKRFFC